MVAHGGDGANIELDNMQGKRGMHFYANYGNQGARLMINSNQGHNGVDIFNNNLTVNGISNFNNQSNFKKMVNIDNAELRVVNKSRGTTHFNYQNKGENYIRGSKLNIDTLDTNIKQSWYWKSGVINMHPVIWFI